MNLHFFVALTGLFTAVVFVIGTGCAKANFLPWEYNRNVQNQNSGTNYDTLVLLDKPVGYWPLSSLNSTDLSAKALGGSFTGRPGFVSMPNGDLAADFDGKSEFYTVKDNDVLSVPTTGVLTLEAWIRPDVDQFTNSEASGYVHWLGKGDIGEYEYVFREYSVTNQVDRGNRISGYAFNRDGGLGAGSYFQDKIQPSEWIQVALVINTVNTNDYYRTGYTKIFKNGIKRDQDRLFDYDILPENGTSPLRIGTRDLHSFFQGAIGKVAVYNYELTPEQLSTHYKAMIPHL